MKHQIKSLQYSQISQARNKPKRHLDEEELFLWKRKDDSESAQETWSRTGP